MTHSKTYSFGSSQSPSRRRILTSGLLAGGAWLARNNRMQADERVGRLPTSQQRYKIGVCDWMMLKRQKLGAFPLANEVGADGVEVDMGSLGSATPSRTR